jgi:glycosyltransferase involved in cell wall biosynthesis
VTTNRPKVLVVITGYEFFIQPILKALKDDFDFTVFNKHLPTLSSMNPIKKKANAIRNTLTYNSKELKRLYASHDATVVEWGGLSLKEITKWASGHPPILARIHRWEATTGYVKNCDFQKVKQVFVHTQAIKDLVLEHSNATSEMIKIVGNVIDLDDIPYPERDQWTYKIAIVGGYTPRKRLELFVQIANRLKHKVSLEFFNTPKEYALQVLKENNHDAKNVTIHPRLTYKEYIKKLGDADFILNVSESEGAPASLHEAMLCGVIPVIRNWLGADSLYPESYVLPFEPKLFVEQASEKINEIYSGPIANIRSNLRKMRVEIQEEALSHWRNTLNEMIKNG